MHLHHSEYVTDRPHIGIQPVVQADHPQLLSESFYVTSTAVERLFGHLIRKPLSHASKAGFAEARSPSAYAMTRVISADIA